MRNLFLVLTLVPFLILGCVKEDFKETFSKTILAPEYSFPMGTTEYILENDFSGSGSGPYGTIYYDDIAYPLYVPYLERAEQKEFSVSYLKTIRNNVESLTFHIIVTNSFPTDIESQIYFLDKNQQILFYAFQNGPLVIRGGKTDSQGKVIEENKQLTEVTFNQQQIEQFNNITYYTIESIIFTQKNGIDPVHFYSTENVNFIVGARVKLKIIPDEL